MGSINRWTGTPPDTDNNLDIFLESTFEDQLRFQIKNKETRFIQTGIETLVQRLVEAVDIHAREEKHRLIADFLLKHEEYVFKCHSTENGIDILRAGSFYEGTKNVYPDEFDFIYVMCTLEVHEYFEEFIWLKHYFTLNDFHEIIKDVLTRTIETKHFKYCDNMCIGERVIFFDGYNRTQGPASKLMFKYEMIGDEGIEEKVIFVDIVPAFQVIDAHLPNKIREVCIIEGFSEEIIATGSYLITNEISFTGTEVHFMKKRLSATHKKAYRLLKYIFNGDDDGEKLRKWVPKAGVSSYMIKAAVINHHFICRYGDTYDSKPAPCVLTILEEILQFCIDYENNDNTCLRKFHGGEFEMQRDNVEQTINFLDEMIEKLQLLQCNDIRTVHLKPISKSILDYIQMQTSTGHISASSSRRQSFSSQYSRELSRSLTSLKKIGLKSTDPSNEQIGVVLNTHDITRRDRQYRKRSNSLSSVENTMLSVYSNKFSDNYLQNVVDKPKKRKSRRCVLM